MSCLFPRAAAYLELVSVPRSRDTGSSLTGPNAGEGRIPEVDFAAAGVFLATSAGRKLTDRSALEADDIDEELAPQIRARFSQCGAASSQAPR